MALMDKHIEALQLMHSSNTPVGECLAELVLLRRAVKELAKSIDNSTFSDKELLYRLKCQGVDTGLSFTNYGSGEQG